MRVFSAALDLFLPPRCPGCDARHATVAFCDGCRARIPAVSAPQCPICGLPFDGAGSDHPCPRCTKRRPRFRRASACSTYRADGRNPLMDALHRLKYGRDVSLAPALASVLAARAQTRFDHDRVLPVPLHRTRLRWRGFNQSLLLARGFCGGRRGRLDPWSLARRRATPPQVGLGETERRRNVRDAFVVVRPDAIRGATVLLVDDVMTTGATMDECARILRRAGARHVDVLVLLRALDTP